MGLQDQNPREFICANHARIRKNCYTIGLGYLHDPDLAEEVVQETLLKAINNLSSYDSGRAGVLTWIETIARSVAIDIGKKVKSEKRMNAYSAPKPDGQIKDPILFLESPDPSVQELAEKKEEIEILRRSMFRLGLEARSSLELFYFEGYKYREIADESKIPLGTVRSRIHRAVKDLRSFFQLEPQPCPVF
jgi:RNA polymerase sigma factor (sigma-70 family)